VRTVIQEFLEAEMTDAILRATASSGDLCLLAIKEGNRSHSRRLSQGRH